MAEQLQRKFYPSQTRVHVVVHGEDFTVAATEWELRKMRPRTCEWYNVKVRGVLGSGKRDVREIETLGRGLRWREEGLEHVASDNNRQALLEGLGLSEGSKTVNRAAAKPEDVGEEEDEEMLEGTKKRGPGACWRC